VPDSSTMDTILQAVVIGVVQGLTEFLPISSSAHLTLLPPLLGWDDDLLNSAVFVVMLHVGTLAALLAYFRADVVSLTAAGIATLRERSLADDPQRRLALAVAISIVPAGVVGLAFEPFFDTWFRERLLVIPAILVVGAAILWLAERHGRPSREVGQVTLRDALVIGLAQALALFPGISRSGITIAAGLFRGLRRDAAARFAFLMGIPIIAGAGAWKAREVLAAPDGTLDWAVLVAGMAASAASGFLAISLLLRFLRTRSTRVFIAYRVAFAIVAAALLLGRQAP
jgi:undecaprenyl-diphosphatase